MFIFDYLYYKIYTFYRNLLNEKDPDIAASAIITLIHICNLIVFITIYEDISGIKLDVLSNKIYYIPVGLLYIGNFFFFRRRIKIFEERWGNFDFAKKQLISRIVVIYLVMILGYIFLHGFIKEWIN